MQRLRTITLCLTLFLPIEALASSVFRCTDPDGKVTFTHHGCSTTQEQQIQDAYNPRPGSGAAVPLAKPDASQTPAAATPSERTLTIVGERQDGCGDLLDGSARREAIIRKQVRQGMTRRDVESALGKPERTSQRNGQTTYHYTEKYSGERHAITFDQNGCVR